jgi:hypothetical protein
VRPRRPSRPALPPRTDETLSLLPPVAVAENTLPPQEPEVIVERPAVRSPRPARSTPLPKRTEPLVLTLLLSGMVLNLLVLLRTPALTRADMLLGGTVLAAGFALLLLIEVFRRTGVRR